MIDRRRRFNQSTIWSSAVLFLAVLLSAFGSAAYAAAAKTLTIGVTQFPSTLNPNIESMLAKTYVLGLTMRPFTIYDHDWQPQCMLCSELPTIENGMAEEEATIEGGRGMAVTYEIRPDARWGDGTPITTDDVLFTYEVGRHPLSGVSNAELYRRILAIDVRDERHFTIHSDRIEFGYNMINDFRLLPAHIEREIFEQDPASYAKRTAFDSDPANPGLAFGPYRVSRIAIGSEIELVPNETWWGEKPAFERVLIKTIDNTAALEANLLSGSIDMIAGELGLTVDQALAFEARHGDGFQVVYKPGLIYEHLDLMLDNPMLADVKVRQALLYAIDRQKLVDQLFQGRQPVAQTQTSPLDWIHDPDVPSYPFDPARAGELLDAAGWTLGPEGLRLNAAGEPFSIELMTTAGNRTRELVEQVIQANWKAIGVEARIRNEPARVLFGETTSRRKFTGAVLFAWLSSPENVPRTTLHSSMIPAAENGWAGQNFVGYRNPEMDSVIDAIEVELDRDKRLELWKELQRIYAETLPALPLYWRAEAYILPKGMTGLRPTGHNAVTTNWVEEWSWSK